MASVTYIAVVDVDTLATEVLPAADALALVIANPSTKRLEPPFGTGAYTAEGLLAAFRLATSNPAAVYADLIAAITPAEATPDYPIVSTITAAYDKTGAVDGAALWASQEVAASHIIVEKSAVINLGATGAYLPTKKISGPGTLRIGGASLSGFQLGYDLPRSSIIFTPSIPSADVAGSTWGVAGRENTTLVTLPDVGGLQGRAPYHNVIISQGSALGGSGAWWRSTIIGSVIGLHPIAWERVEAIGNGTLQFAGLIERSVVIGSIACQHIGRLSKAELVTYEHDWFVTATALTDVLWAFNSLSNAAYPAADSAYRITDPTRSIGAAIDNFTNYATNTNHVSGIVAIGRDAMLHTARGTFITALGYQALTHLFFGNNMVAVGSFALGNNVFGSFNVGVGYAAGQYNVDGTLNTFVGNIAGQGPRYGSKNVVIGASAGGSDDYDVVFSAAAATKSMIKSLNSSVLIGYQSGKGWGLGVTVIADVLAIQNKVEVAPLISGDFANFLVGVNVKPIAITAGDFFSVYGTPTVATNADAGTKLFSVRAARTTINSGFLNLGAVVAPASVAAGVVTVTASRTVLDIAASGDLTTINGGADGDILILAITSNARTITAKDGAVNLQLSGDFLMDNTQDRLTLINVGGTAWHEIARSGNA